MKDIKEIGKVIQINDYSETEDGVHVKVTRKIVMDNGEYEILPVQCGDFAKITPDINFNEVISKAKMDLCKHLDEHIEIFTNEDIETNRFWVKAGLVILANKKESEEA